jgi:erythronate-4-phosphate dehydrogenase
MKITADDKIPFLKGVLEPFSEISYLRGDKIVNKDIADTDILFTRTRTRCNEALLKGTRVKIIGTATIGFDHIDTSYCEKSGIMWYNAPGCNSSSVMQYMASALMEVLAFTARKPDSLTLGIIGAGNVGEKVKHFALNAGFRVLVNDPPREEKEGKGDFTDLSDLLKHSDIVTVHVPLSDSGKYPTYHMVDWHFISSMKKGAWFFNTSRGEVADTVSLKRGVSGRQLGGIVLDVWEKEPQIDRELLDMSFIATPHIAGYSTDGKANGTSMIVRKLASVTGLPLLDWYPVITDLPEFPIIIPDADPNSVFPNLSYMVKHTYDIRKDDISLKAEPGNFEILRGGYPVRREFSAYSVKAGQLDSKVLAAAKSIGFNIV